LAQAESMRPRQKTYAKKHSLCRSLPLSLTICGESTLTKCCERAPVELGHLAIASQLPPSLA